MYLVKSACHEVYSCNFKITVKILPPCNFLMGTAVYSRVLKVCEIILNFWLVYSLEGAGLCTLISSGVNSVSYYYVNKLT